MKLKKKDLILDTSFELIQKEGLESFSLKRISKELKMAQSGIFYYFKNSEQFFFDLIAQQLREESNYLLAQIQLTKNPKRSVRRYFFYFLEYYQQRPELYKLVYFSSFMHNLTVPQKKKISIIKKEMYDFFEDFCVEHYKAPEQFINGLVLLRLQAQSLLKYYFSNYTENSDQIFEQLCKDAWRVHQNSLFK